MTTSKKSVPRMSMCTSTPGKSNTATLFTKRTRPYQFSNGRLTPMFTAFTSAATTSPAYCASMRGASAAVCDDSNDDDDDDDDSVDTVDAAGASVAVDALKAIARDSATPTAAATAHPARMATGSNKPNSQQESR
jgi:hypothetical protein